mmetsp:Transcript_13709/g.37010  ORF Transcript_13709/g.37010 Transcript_13709/m.37010 type:complete len:350 (-) Transcript_13709:926-1975(-)
MGPPQEPEGLPRPPEVRPRPMVGRELRAKVPLRVAAVQLWQARLHRAAALADRAARVPRDAVPQVPPAGGPRYEALRDRPAFPGPAGHPSQVRSATRGRRASSIHVGGGCRIPSAGPRRPRGGGAEREEASGALRLQHGYLRGLRGPCRFDGPAHRHDGGEAPDGPAGLRPPAAQGRRRRHHRRHERVQWAAARQRTPLQRVARHPWRPGRGGGRAFWRFRMWQQAVGGHVHEISAPGARTPREPGRRADGTTRRGRHGRRRGRVQFRPLACLGVGGAHAGTRGPDPCERQGEHVPKAPRLRGAAEAGCECGEHPDRDSEGQRGGIQAAGFELVPRRQPRFLGESYKQP